MNIVPERSWAPSGLEFRGYSLKPWTQVSRTEPPPTSLVTSPTLPNDSPPKKAMTPSPVACVHAWLRSTEQSVDSTTESSVTPSAAAYPFPMIVSKLTLQPSSR